MTVSRFPWRVGRKVGRTIYRQTGPDPSDADELIGVMDTPELAHEVVTTRNAFWPMPRLLGHPPPIPAALRAAADKLDAQAEAHGQAIHDYTDLLRVWADSPTRWDEGC